MTPLLTGAAILSAVPAGWAADACAGLLTHGQGPRPPVAATVAISVLGSATLAAFSPAAAWPIGTALGWSLLVLTAADLAVFRLPDLITLPLIFAGLALTAMGLTGSVPDLGFSPDALVQHAIGAATGYGAFAGIAAAYRRLRGHDGLGLGDAKLAAAGGAWLGWRLLPLVVLIACGVAFAWVAIRLIRQGRTAITAPLPFGPPLALAIWTLWLAQDRLG